MTNTNTTATARAQNWTEPGAAATPAAAPSSERATKEMFLQLLVAQIKNQNPLNPADGVEFLSQLSQFTQVEQTLGVREDLARILAALETANQQKTPTE